MTTYSSQRPQHPEDKPDYAREMDSARRVKAAYEQRMQFVLPRAGRSVEELMSCTKAQLIKEFRTDAPGYRGYIDNASVPKAEMVVNILRNLDLDFRYLMRTDW